jgi:hypothetical protein
VLLEEYSAPSGSCELPPSPAKMYRRQGDSVERDWETLIGQIEEQAAMYAVQMGDEPVRHRPGASEEQIVAAEQRLGFLFDPCYREFLTYSNGWAGFSFGDEHQYSLDELGVTARWADNKAGADEWADIDLSEVAPGSPPWDSHLLIAASHLVWSITLCPPAGSASGRILTVEDDVRAFDDFYAYLQEVLRIWIYCNDKYGDAP